METAKYVDAGVFDVPLTHTVWVAQTEALLAHTPPGLWPELAAPAPAPAGKLWIG
jgi:hypothetical protein